MNAPQLSEFRRVTRSDLLDQLRVLLDECNLSSDHEDVRACLESLDADRAGRAVCVASDDDGPWFLDARGEPYAVTFVRAGDGAIGWKIDDGETYSADEWPDILEEVCLLDAPQQLSHRELQRWQEACEAGLGPDADADVNGVRWVVRSEIG